MDSPLFGGFKSVFLKEMMWLNQILGGGIQCRKYRVSISGVMQEVRLHDHVKHWTRILNGI